MNREKLSEDQLKAFFEDISRWHSVDEITFVCIGTDRSTGDALGPLTGSRLLKSGFPHVVGTLPDPCDSVSLEDKLSGIPKQQVIVAVDACLGHPSSVGSFFAKKGPLSPAQSVGQKLPEVGHYSIAAVVNVLGPKPYWTLQVTPLYRVMTMAHQIADAAASGFGLSP